MSSKYLGHLFALLSNVCFGLNFLFLKIAIAGNASPLFVTFCRVLVAWSIFAIIAHIGKPKIQYTKIPITHWLIFLLAGICGASLNQISLVSGISRSSVVHGSSIALLLPSLVLIWEYFILRNVKFKTYQYLGLLLGIAGAIILSVYTQTEQSLNWLGNLLIFGNFFLFSIYLIIVRWALKFYTISTILFISFGFGSVIMIILSPIMFSNILIESLEYYAYIGILGSIIFASVLAQIFQTNSLKHISASVSSAYIYVQPILGSILAIIFLGESIMIAQLVAFSLIALGLYLTSFRSMLLKSNDKNAMKTSKIV